VFVSHGRNDPVIGVEFAHQARDRLQRAGLPVEYHEYGGGHQIEPDAARAGIDWLNGVL
jgi:phospholipase/carboxylesterase